MTALVERARALRAQGLSLRAIARELGAGYGTVQLALVGWAPPPVAVPVAEPRGCQFPLSERRPWRFCDQPATKGVWCAEHYRICYTGRGGTL